MVNTRAVRRRIGLDTPDKVAGLQWVVMIVGPTETPDIYGPFRSHARAKAAAAEWNAANPPDLDGDLSDQFRATSWPLPNGRFLIEPAQAS